MRNILKAVLCVNLAMLSVLGCGKDNLSKQKEAIIGSWVQIEPVCVRPACDTVIFGSDRKVISNIYFIGSKDYQILSFDSMLIGNNRHYYELSNNRMLIENFIIPDFGTERESILLIKNQ